ncbi:MAG: hypothetical protein ACOX3R_06800 [Desulfitobacteriia bacterium]|jgi:CRP/FNR family cyclic AMP-dependent transcriptional regulator
MGDCIKIPGTILPESFNRVDRLEKYLHLGNMRSFSKGSIVLAQGTEFNSLMYVQSGCLEVSMGTDDGHSNLTFAANLQKNGRNPLILAG